MLWLLFSMQWIVGYEKAILWLALGVYRMNKFKHRDPDWWKDIDKRNEEFTRAFEKQRERVWKVQLFVLCTLTAAMFIVLTMLGWFIGKLLIGQ